MSYHDSVAKSVRLQKEKHPERYCSAKNCLWRTEGGTKPCPKHSVPSTRFCMRCHVNQPLGSLMLCRECDAERAQEIWELPSNATKAISDDELPYA